MFGAKTLTLSMPIEKERVNFYFINSIEAVTFSNDTNWPICVNFYMQEEDANDNVPPVLTIYLYDDMQVLGFTDLLARMILNRDTDPAKFDDGNQYNNDQIDLDYLIKHMGIKNLRVNNVDITEINSCKVTVDGREMNQYLMTFTKYIRDDYSNMPNLWDDPSMFDTSKFKEYILGMEYDTIKELYMDLYCYKKGILMDNIPERGVSYPVQDPPILTTVSSVPASSTEKTPIVPKRVDGSEMEIPEFLKGNIKSGDE